MLAVVRRIPPGAVATYGDVAVLAGRPRAWRAAGNVLRGCADAATPCHRVVGAGGALGGYGGNLPLKRALLRAEGVEVGVARVRRFREVRWTPAVMNRARGSDTMNTASHADHGRRTRQAGRAARGRSGRSRP
ncbi:MAG: MGMT family protein [Acidobacteria bacterium]|nr:MGMT family protein [Acidobacteriota bacterium]